jgi:phosphoglycerate dehydrogenase-like enzyme
MRHQESRPADHPKVLFFDPIGWVHEWSYDEEWQALGPLGVEFLIPGDRDERDRMLAEADVVVVSSVDTLTASHVSELARCVGILCYSAGMDAVDVDAAHRAGIQVTNVRAGTADVADHAFALLLAVWRRLPEMISEAGAGRWDLAQHPQLRQIRRLEGSTLGIFGAGAIGRAVASRGRAFGMRTIATYRRPDAAEAELPHVSLEGLAAESDAIVLTASLNAATKGIIDGSVFTKMKRGVILVNVGRGGLVVEPDLAEALDAGIVAGAGLDVRDPEPPDPANDPLAGRPEVLVTPHLGGLSSEAMSSLHRLAAEGIESLLRQGGRL